MIVFLDYRESYMRDLISCFMNFNTSFLDSLFKIICKKNYL